MRSLRPVQGRWSRYILLWACPAVHAGRLIHVSLVSFSTCIKVSLTLQLRPVSFTLHQSFFKGRWKPPKTKNPTKKTKTTQKTPRKLDETLPFRREPWRRWKKSPGSILLSLISSIYMGICLWHSRNCMAQPFRMHACHGYLHTQWLLCTESCAPRRKKDARFHFDLLNSDLEWTMSVHPLHFLRAPHSPHGCFPKGFAWCIHQFVMMATASLITFV